MCKPSGCSISFSLRGSLPTMDLFKQSLNFCSVFMQSSLPSRILRALRTLRPLSPAFWFAHPGLGEYWACPLQNCTASGGPGLVEPLPVSSARTSRIRDSPKKRCEEGQNDSASISVPRQSVPQLGCWRLGVAGSGGGKGCADTWILDILRASSCVARECTRSWT